MPTSEVDQGKPGRFPPVGSINCGSWASTSGDITTVKGKLLAAPNRPYTLWIHFGSNGYGYDVATDALGFHEFAYSYTNPGAFGQVNAEERNLIWPNRLQNYPVLTDARLAAGTTVVDGTFDSEPDETYRIEFFVNRSADESGYGEGEVYLGFQEVTTGPDGLASFIAILPIAVAYGQFLTATATDSEGNTSEFSAAFQVLPRFDQIDYGDAPGELFGTRLSQNGARHAIVPGFHLGASIDGEADGQPESSALGDDSSGLDDEDGVRFPSPIVPGLVAVVEVTASANGFLDAWIDWNRDGQWDEAQERAFGTMPVSEGRNLLSIVVPADAVPGTAFGRFRFSSAGGLSPTGMAWDGEVEDNPIPLAPPPANRPPVARDDEGTTLAGLALAVPVLDNDNDPDGNLDPSTLTLLVVADNGSCYVEASTGRILYTPDAGYVGEDRFQYEVRDSEGLSDWAAVVVTILAGNRPPVAADDLAQTAQGQPVTIPILANDFDADGDPMSLVSITDTGVPGRLVIDAQVVVFLPNSVFVSETAFDYTITKGFPWNGSRRSLQTVLLPPDELMSRCPRNRPRKRPIGCKQTDSTTLGLLQTKARSCRHAAGPSWDDRRTSLLALDELRKLLRESPERRERFIEWVVPGPPPPQ